MAVENDFGRGFTSAGLSVLTEMKALTRGHRWPELIRIILIKTYSAKSFFPQNSVQVNSMAIEDSYSLRMESLAFVCV